MICSSCHQVNAGGDTYCVHCGKALTTMYKTIFCKSCGRECYDDGRKVCTRCGAKLLNKILGNEIEEPIPASFTIGANERTIEITGTEYQINLLYRLAISLRDGTIFEDMKMVMGMLDTAREAVEEMNRPVAPDAVDPKLIVSLRDGKSGG